MHADYTVQETLFNVHTLFIGPITTLFRKKKKKVKMSLTILFTHLKIYFTTVFSVFNFQQNKLYSNGLLVWFA